MTTTSAALVDVDLGGRQLMIWRLADGRWRVAFGDVDETGRQLVALLEGALGRYNPDVFRYAVQAMEAAESTRGPIA